MKKIILCCLLIAAAALMSACAERETYATDGDVTVVRLAKPKSISDPTGLIELFEAENPDIKIKMVDMPRSDDERHNIYVSALSGGEDTVDIYWMNDLWMEEFVKQGYLFALDRYIQPDSDVYMKDAKEAFTVNNSVYGLPVAMDMDVLYYRKDLIRELPMKWDSIFNAVKETTAKKTLTDGLCLENEAGSDMIYSIIEMKRSMGCDYKKALITYRSTLNNAAAPGKNKEHIIPFKTGNALFLKERGSVWNELNGDVSAVRGKVEAVQLPKTPDQKPSAFVTFYGLGINAQSAQINSAIRFLEFLNQSDNQRLLARDYGLMPVMEGLYQDEMIIDANPHFAGIQELIKDAPRYRDVNLSSEQIRMLEEVLRNYLAGETEPDAAAASFEKVCP